MVAAVAGHQQLHRELYDLNIVQDAAKTVEVLTLANSALQQQSAS